MEEQLNDRIIDVDLEKEMKKSFLDYSMSVIVSRALPDVRDGLKPVQCSDATTRTVTPPSTTRLSVWRRISPCAICSWTATATSVPWTAIPLLHTVIPRQG